MDIFLEQLSLNHLEGYIELVNSKIVHATTEPGEQFEELPKSKVIAWLKGLSLKNDRKDFAIIEKSTSEFVGEVVLNEIENSTANIRIAILPKFFNKGFGTQAIQKACTHGFRDLNLDKIELWVFNINPRGIKVYQKCGFREVEIRKINEGLSEIKMQLAKNNSEN